MGRRTGKVAFSDAKYDRGSERLQPFKAKLVQLLHETFDSGCILDLGCGSGLVSTELKRIGCDVIGVDISLSAVRKYRAAGYTGLICDLEKPLPFKDEMFDGVWISEVIEHIVEYAFLISEIYRVLKPKGKLYLTTPNSAFFGYRLLFLLGKCPTELQHPYHVRFYSYDFLEKCLSNNGFKISHSLGQNIYFYLPDVFVRVLSNLPDKARLAVWKLLELLGLRLVPGMIRGNKLMGYWFGTRLRKLLSNCIMIVSVKRQETVRVRGAKGRAEVS